jgi:hypothetical protein
MPRVRSGRFFLGGHMTTQSQNQKAIREGQQGGPAQKNQAAQGALGAERDRNAPSGVQPEGGDLPSPQQQAELNPKQQPKELLNQNPGQTHTPGGKGKQDAPQNQKRSDACRSRADRQCQTSGSPGTARRASASWRRGRCRSWGSVALRLSRTRRFHSAIRRRAYSTSRRGRSRCSRQPFGSSSRMRSRRRSEMMWAMGVKLGRVCSVRKPLGLRLDARAAQRRSPQRRCRRSAQARRGLKSTDRKRLSERA